ncbi:MAG: serine/threonine protein kinase, partial [Actinomycetota bacterium]|nr:serine/threonine protein kinase [Actinomycetota bacterium]
MALDTHGELLVGRYRKLAAIGVGGMARVYLAHDELLGRRVAIKLLHADSPDDGAIRFRREAKLGASLNHPNLVSIFDIVTDDESVLIVMEYVDGETLRDAVARGPVPPERAVEVIRDVAAGLDHAHAHGVVHRDVKPANILLRHDGIAKVADLGIATAAERTAITRSDVVLGTASYMAPEQLTGDRAGPRSDVYALAAVAFEALSGRKVRSGKTPVEVAHEVVSGPPPDLGAVWPDAPPDAATALVRGMARDPEDRPASAGALARELER